MVIIEDTGNKIGKHEIKHKYWDENNIKWIRNKLPTGDYTRLDNMSVVIDTKKDIQELIMDVTKDHERFRDEMQRAIDTEIKLIFLVENKDGVRCKNDLFKWYNWRLKVSPRATTGKTLYKILTTMEEEYNTEFLFCTPEESPKIIIDILKNIDKKDME